MLTLCVSDWSETLEEKLYIRGILILTREERLERRWLLN